jgi:membrane associated rhomboid family serine protease
LQNIGFEEPIMDVFHYPAYSWEDQEVWRYFTHAIVHFSVPHSFDLPEGFFTMLLVGLVFGFISPLFGINIGNAAHISGFILGLVWGFLQSKIKAKSFS